MSIRCALGWHDKEVAEWVSDRDPDDPEHYARIICLRCGKKWDRWAEHLKEVAAEKREREEKRKRVEEAKRQWGCGGE